MTGNRKKGPCERRFKDPNKAGDAPENEDISPTLRTFKNYQAELDAKHDKYERLVKRSRDLTIESKRIIFLLHRVTSSGSREEILKEAEDRLSSLFTNALNDIALELNEKREVHQYIKAFTAGLQEFVEALSFYFYLKKGSLITLEQVYDPCFMKTSEVTQEGPEEEKTTKADLQVKDLLSPLDYILGIGDLTGELMRKCINSVAAGDIDEPFKLSDLLQSIYNGLMVCTSYSRELKRKVFTLKSSLQKVENACYAIKIRGTETPKHMLADFFSSDDYNDVNDCDL